MTSNRVRDFLLVKVVPTTSPILATDFSAPIAKKAVPKIIGTEEIKSEVMTGPNFSPEDSTLNPGITKFRARTTRTIGRMDSDASLKRASISFIGLFR